MRTTLKRLFITALAVVLLFGSAITCFAAAQNGKITVALEDKEKNQINNLTVNICQIAELNNTGYYPAKTFENSGISIAGVLNNPDATAAKTIADYIKKNRIETISQTSKDGKVSFDKLELGIWLIFPEEDSTYIFNPYIVFLPSQSGGMLHYEVTTAPKLDNNTLNRINIYVVKKWDDKNNASKKRPDAVTVELLDGDRVIGYIALSEKNGWSHTFLKLPKDGNYSVREKSVADYKAEYSGDAVNGFLVTNTYVGEKLPQTGQHWWPVILIAVSGTCFILLGVYELGVKKNGKKE